MAEPYVSVNGIDGILGQEPFHVGRRC